MSTDDGRGDRTDGAADGDETRDDTRGDEASAGQDTQQGAGQQGGQDAAPSTGVVPGEQERVVPPRPPRRTGVFLDPEDLREHVGGLLRVILGGYEVDAFGNFTFTHEGARIVVTVGATPIGPQVGVFSVTNLDIQLTSELARFLLVTNHTLGFGSFSYDPRNEAVWLRHSLLGTTLDLPELQATLAAIATTAAGLDHTIQERFGGRTFDEAPDDVQRRMEPPEPSQDPARPGMRGYL